MVVQTSPYERELKTGDYSKILSISEPAISECDLYIKVRSYIILGRYSEAKCQLQKFQTAWYLEFLRLQVILFEEGYSVATLESLHVLGNSIPCNNYLRGEYYFILGYANNLGCNYQKAVSFHKKAAEIYRQDDIWPCVAHALFNLAICFDHLNHPELESVANEIRHLDQRHRLNSIRAVQLRLSANLSLDREEYATATSILWELEKLLKSLGRTRDRAGALASLAFCLSLNSNGDLSSTKNIDLLKQTVADDLTTFPKIQQKALNEIMGIWDLGIFGDGKAVQLIRTWRKFPATFQLRLLFLLSEKLMRAQSYEMLLQVARNASRLSQNSSQAPYIVDFRYFEALSYYHLGEYVLAQKQNNVYLNAARDIGSNSRIDRGLRLQELLEKAAMRSIPISENPQIIYNAALRNIEINGQKISLVGLPMVNSLVHTLSKGTAGIALPILYQEIYGDIYDPIMNEKRLNSLIDRTRRTLKANDLIIREGGLLGWTPAAKVQVIHNSVRCSAQHIRQEQLYQLFSRNVEPLSIRSIEIKFGVTRRTLQMDLKKLRRAGRIHMNGVTRKSSYFVP